MYNVSKNKLGISLITLIISIVIIIILTGAVLLNLITNSPIELAKEATILNNIDTVQSSLELLRLKVMSETFSDTTTSDLINKGIVAQIPLKDINENTDLYNAIIVERFEIKY